MERREAKANSREKTPPLVPTPPNPEVQMQRQEQVEDSEKERRAQVLLEEDMQAEHSPNQIKLHAGTPESAPATDLLGDTVPYTTK
eukprot:1158518-Pelagomonas_calceolata.AAC.8